MCFKLSSSSVFSFLLGALGHTENTGQCFALNYWDMFLIDYLPDHQLSSIGDHHFILMLWLMFSELVDLFKTIVHMELQNVQCFSCFSITTKVNEVPFFFVVNLTALTFSFAVLQFLICMYCTSKVIHNVLFCDCYYGFI